MRSLSSTSQTAKLMSLLAVGVALLAAIPIGNAISQEDDRLLVFVMMICAGAVASVMVLGNWRRGMAFLMVWIVFEDLIRKFMGNSMVVYAGKDMLAVTIYVSFFVSRHLGNEARLQLPSLQVPLLAFVAWVILSAFNPQMDNVAVPLLGIRMTLFYVPLLYVGYAFFRNDLDFRKFLTLMVIIAAAVASLGILQSIVGLDLLNPADAPHLRLYLTRYSPESSMAVPRPNGTFVDAGRFGQYMLFSVFVGLGFLGYLYSSRDPANLRRRRWALLLWVVSVIGLFLSGGRGPILFALLSVPVLLYAQVWDKRRQQFRRSVFPVGRVMVGSILFLVLLGSVVPDRFEAVSRFMSETIDPRRRASEFDHRPASYWRNNVDAYQRGGLLGHGTGSASLGRQYLTPFLSEQQAYQYRAQTEGGYASVLWEWGVVGLVLWVWWSLALMKALYTATRQSAGTRFFWVAASISVCVFIVLFPIFYMGMQVYQNYVTQALLWFLVGMVLRFTSIAQTPEIVGQPQPRIL